MLFSKINQISPLLHYKNYTTNTSYPDGELLQIPLWLLDVDDVAQLLGVTTSMQLPIIEKALKLVTILKNDDEEVMQHKK